MKLTSMLLGLTILPVLSSCGFEVVDTGRRGLVIKYGEVQGEPLKEGLHWYNPFTTDILELPIREQKIEGATAAFTKDTQKVDIQFALTWYANPDKVAVLYKQFGGEDAWEEKIVKPMALGAIKDTVGQFVADDMVSKREAARDKVVEELKAGLEARSITLTRLDFTNLDFDDQYEKAVEAKVVAVQKAAEAKNKTVEIEEQAKQKVIAAEAEAKSMSIRSKALSENKSLVEYEAVQKWDGQLPQYMMGNSVPFINMSSK